MGLTYDEIVVEVLDIKYIGGSTKGYTLPPGVNKITDNILMLKSLLPKEVKVSIKIDDMRRKSNIITHKTNRFTEKNFVYIILGFIQSYSVVLVDFEGFVELIPGTYEQEIDLSIVLELIKFI